MRMRKVRPIIVGNATIFVEVDDAVQIELPTPAEGAVLDLDGRVADALEKLGDLKDQVSDVCAAMYEAVQKAIDTVHPDEVTVEFGLMLGGEVGVPFMAKGKVEANVGITMKWDLTKPKPLANV